MTGDTDDLAARLWSLLPAGWFGRRGDSPVVKALVDGAAWALSFAYQLYAFAKAMTRIATQVGPWLELTAGDFFARFQRLAGEGDAAYSRRIRLEVLRPRNTRHAIDRAVYDLTGNHPDIFEAWRPGDCAAYGAPTSAYGVTGTRYGTRPDTFDVWITTPFPANYGIPNVPGYGATRAAYGSPDTSFHYVDDADIQGAGVTTTDILNALERVRTAGVTYLVDFTGL